ncbi:F0F1 ATP synthase subunit A [Lactovum miscens]|uniref:ATP synthase subunit a n=1 Tax=Lactovum miscens TaxID=190387 RepID=A0A841C7V5_9LACT|nr:F0F1 ATP synthase subunit A [Lactovum miscens]MBB5887479.1 F-type H+-transporting ATPase subunit a [Lactovum miscens]
MESTWTFNLGPIAFDGTITTMTLLAVLIIFLLVFWASRKMTIVPKGKQNVLEFVVDFVNGIIKDQLGASESQRYSLFAFSLFSFILISNEIGLLTKIDVHDVALWKSPTANPIVTLTLAGTVIVLSNLLGAKKFGVIKYFKNSFLKPPAFILPLNLLEEFTNTLSLGLRLYGNIFAGEIMLGLIASLVSNSPALYPLSILLEVIWIGFSFFIGAVQAYVFTLLSSIYLSHKVVAEH